MTVRRDNVLLKNIFTKNISTKNTLYLPTVWVTNGPSLSIHDVIKPLYYVAKAIRLSPYKYNSNNQVVPLTKRDKAITYISVIAFILCYLWTLYAILILYLAQQTPSLIVTEVTYSLLIHFFAIFSVLLMNSNFGDLTKNFYLELDTIGKHQEIFPTDLIYYALRQKYMLEMAAMTCFGLGLDGFDVIAAIINNDYSINLLKVTRFIAQYILVTVYFQINAKVEVLLTFFQCVNEKFSSSILPLNNEKELSVELKSEHVKLLCQIHGKLSNLIHISNDSHGWQIVLMDLTVVALVVNSLYTAIIYAPDPTKLSGVVMWVQQILFMAFYFSLIVILAARCSAARKQALKTGLLANDILLEMEPDDTNKFALLYKERLQLLVSQISYRNPHFSAGGVFSVDYTTVSAVTSAIASYLIIFLQFMENPTCYFVTNGTSISQV